ncbi:MAG: HAMP domain-containing sensor histidine kinase [Betaproteobacteria bacterium]|nr:HAMP domain-containing sensor histidine kinase [Betaproteobacteria bacterium]
MRFLLNLSFRYKVPLWGSLLIVGTALIISSTLLLRSYGELKSDLLRDATTQGRTMATTLFSAVLHDQVWRAYEIIKAPFSRESGDGPGQVESLVVLDQKGQIYVSTNPERLPMLADFARLSPEFASLAGIISQTGRETRVLEPEGSDHLFVATPIREEQAHLGTLVQIYSKKVLRSRFLKSAGQAALIAALVIVLLLPIGWYWGQRTAVPLLRLTERMEELGRRLPDDLAPELYDYQDELGRLYRAYNRTLHQLREKAQIEGQMIHSERLAAIGKLTAGIAHEVNNPLVGMLTALDTLRHHDELSPRTLKTLTLLERGLMQIKDTVGALLVEAKVKSRDLLSQDVEDVRTLIEPQARERGVSLRWENQVQAPLSLPSSSVRQMLINLLLNAVQASARGGEISATITADDAVLSMVVVNGGQILTDKQIAHLFEPFANADERGHGLGLWVCYQIARQLGGNIEVESESRDGAGRTAFKVTIPFGAPA